MSPRGGLGIDRRVVGILAGVTLVAAGLGFAIASGLDAETGTVAIVPPATVVAPESVDPAPATPVRLPPVVVTGPADPPATTSTEPATPLPAVPPPATAPDAPVVTAPPPERPVTTTTPPQAPARPVRPAGDAGDVVPFRPAPASAPLPQVVVPAAEFPADMAAARTALQAALRTAPAGGATRSDIRRALALAARFPATTFPGRRATVERTVRLNAWWYARRDAPSGRTLVRDPDGMVYSYATGRGFAWNPVGTAGRWQRLNADVPSARLAETLLTMAVADQRAGRMTLSWEYYDVPDLPGAIRPGVSGMAQARIAHLMANAYGASGDGRFATAAAEAMASLAVPVDAGGSRSEVAYPRDATPSVWYVERAYPGEDPWKGAALNGFMVAVLELLAAERALRQPGPAPAGEAAALEARRLADDGAASLDRLLPAHDAGGWSYYGMLTPGKPFRTYLANATYHCFHVALLRDLGAAYPSLTFGAVAQRWGDDAVRAGVTCPAPGG